MTCDEAFKDWKDARTAIRIATESYNKENPGFVYLSIGWHQKCELCGKFHINWNDNAKMEKIKKEHYKYVVPYMNNKQK